MRKLFPLLLIAVVTFAVYAPTLRNDFVWDDRALVLADPLIRSWRLIPEGFNHFLFTDATASDFYRPLQRLTYTLEYAAYGFAPLGYHVVSVACHIAAAIALYFLAGELLLIFGLADERKRRWVPLAAALVWAIHPLHTSAVAYVSGRADPLAAAFGFAGLYFGIRSNRAAGWRGWMLTALCGLAFLLSVLSKEAGFIYLIALFAIFALQREWRAMLRIGLVSLFVLVPYLALRLGAMHVPPPESASTMRALVRPILVARAVAEYTGLAFLPINLHMERDVETRPSGFGMESVTGAAWRELQTLAGIILAAAFIYWLMRERKRDRAIFACLVLTLICYLPASGLYRLNATVAEHWLYAPLAFFFLALTLALARWLETERLRVMPALRLGIALAAVVWVLFLGGRTFLRTFDWKDQRTFLTRTIAQGGNTPRMLINLGGLELTEGRLDEAKALLDQALQKDPAQPFAIINRAAVALKQNDFAAAHELLKRATQMPLVEAQAYELMVLLESKETGKVNRLKMRLATRTGPPNWSIEKRYIKLLDEMGETDGAIAETRHCLQSQWYRAETWQLLSELLAKSGRAEAAAEAAERAKLYDTRLRERLRTRG